MRRLVSDLAGFPLQTAEGRLRRGHDSSLAFVRLPGQGQKRLVSQDFCLGCQTGWMHRIVALALPQVAAFDLAIPAQIFGHEDQHDRYSFALAAETAGMVPSTTGFAVQAPLGLEALLLADTVIVPGYTPHDPPSLQVQEALRAAAGRGARMVSVCTGAFALAAAGLLDGRGATTHWHHADELAARYPTIEVNADVLYVDAGAVLTSAGVAAGIDLCLHLLRTDYGGHVAATVARRMVVAPHREGGQAQFLQRPVPVSGTSLEGYLHMGVAAPRGTVDRCRPCEPRGVGTTHLRPPLC